MHRVLSYVTYYGPSILDKYMYVSYKKVKISVELFIGNNGEKESLMDGKKLVPKIQAKPLKRRRRREFDGKAINSGRPENLIFLRKQLKQ